MTTIKNSIKRKQSAFPGATSDAWICCVFTWNSKVSNTVLRIAAMINKAEYASK